MTLENLGPLMDELCAVLHGKGCTVREVAVTYAPLVPGEALDPGASCSRVDTGVLVKRGNLTRPPFGVLQLFGTSRVPGPLPIAVTPHCPQAQSLALGMCQS